VKQKASESKAEQWMAGKADPEPLLADADREISGNDKEGRTQRQTMALREVRYRLHARIVPWPGFEGQLSALEAQFRRRAEHGKCVYQPCFGCREFPAFFELADTHPAKKPIAWDADIGWMLYDVFDLSTPGTCDSKPCISLFSAKVIGGVMDVPEYESDAVRKGNSRC
jgi:CRISPR-associated protein Cas5d